MGEAHSGNTAGSLVDVDYRALVSQSDLLYQSPAAQSIEGQPIGNGRMGTLVWNTPNAIHFQIRCLYSLAQLIQVGRCHLPPFKLRCNLW